MVSASVSRGRRIRSLRIWARRGRGWRLSLLFAVLLVEASSGAIQTPAAPEASEVVGRIVDDSGRPLRYLNALIKGTTAGAFTDSDGLFRIRRAPRPGDSLYVCGVGYFERTLPLDEYRAGDTIRVALHFRWDLRGDAAAADTLVRAIRSAPRVEAYLVRGRLYPETTSPNFRHYPVVDTLTQPSRAWLGKLCGLLREAARDSCGGGPTMCVFEPEYAFRFHDEPRPLELLVTRDCSDLEFYRGPVVVSSGSGGGIDCVRQRLQELLEQIADRKGDK
jgi:hypothetical protein